MVPVWIIFLVDYNKFFCMRENSLTTTNYHDMKKLLALSMAFLSIVLLDACKKEPKNQTGGGGGTYTTTDVKVVLPAGSSVDLSKTKIWTMAQMNSVNSNGNAKVPFVTNGCELAFLFDNSDNLLLAGYIYDGNKEISVTSTALFLLYQGLGLNILPDSTRQIFLTKNINNVRLADYYSKIEQAFKTDVLMLEKRSFMTPLNEAVSMITDVKPVDIYAKQLDIVDNDVRSQIQIEKIDDENVNIKNTSYRRAHAFVYKTAYKDMSDKVTTLLYNIDYDDKADKDIKVEKVQYVKNSIDMYAQYYSSNPAITGPIAIPLASNEKEATYKIRVVGPGKPGATLTDAEKTKLDELYEEYLAYNILAPFLAEVVGVRSKYTINEDNLSTYLQKVKTIAQLDPSILQDLKNGNGYNFIPGKFFKAMDNAGQSRVNLVNSFLDGFRAQFPNRTLPTSQQITQMEKVLNKGLDLMEYLTGTTSSKFILAAHDYFNTMEEFTVKAKDNDVKINPRKSDVMAFTNHPLTVEANPSLSNGESIEYEWTTTGAFGVLKDGSQEGTSFTTTTKTINYYGKTTPNENNMEQVVVTAYVKGSNGRTKYGADTATINVKKIKIVMIPDGATLSPKQGVSSIKLYLRNPDGTDPIVNNSSVQYRVRWSTSGSYGYFTGGVKQQTTSVNNITYIATDDEVTKATETISAVVEFRITQGSGWTPWMHRETINGTVNIENDVKKKIYYVSLYEVHTDTTSGPNIGVCMGRGVANVKIEPDAIKYSVRVMGTFGGLWDKVHTWTPGNHPQWFVGYGHPRGINGNYYTVSASVTRQRNFALDNPNHDGVPLMGMAEVTVWLK